VLSLAGATPSQLPGVPPADGYATSGNIEGAVWIAGALYVSQIRGGVANPPPSRVLKIVPGGAVTPFISVAGTNGLALDQRGALLGAVHADGSISRFDLSNPAAPAVPIVSRFSGERFNSPNDLAVRSDGTIYFSDPSWQSADPKLPERAYRVRPNESTPEVISQYHAGEGALEWVAKPNGVTLSRDERALYIGGTGGLYRFDVAADGAVEIGEPVTAIVGGVDGMTKDCAGNLYVTNGQKVVVLGSDDARVGDISLTGNAVTNVAFGGTENKTLFVTSMGTPPRVHRVELNVPGYPY
jgi:gluconolactonase